MKNSSNAVILFIVTVSLNYKMDKEIYRFKNETGKSGFLHKRPPLFLHILQLVVWFIKRRRVKHSY